ncbi:acyl-CoA dehydrogenase family protein [Parendozoicomonas sp. Alg238-R29]|uniref:acyl-CoA dehydrogenase family protein n=1 Tax=Parendozoicomonas sp. Alg238-R29 TaxID=2993446 RepID=UPI00248E60CE|nr:acyl-CoA dehydrogenase family protein [Parendozoicomonas sp. Alg238-R29]
MSEHSNSSRNNSIYPQAEACAANTHVVENMPPVLENYNMFTQDSVLTECVTRGKAEWALDSLQEFGALCGSAERIQWGVDANRHKPEFNTHDRYGRRIDQVDFHPSYHQLMTASKQQGLAGSPWEKPQAGAHVARAAGSYLSTQIEAGHGCPITMTFASVPTLQKDSGIASEWIPKVQNRGYDPRNVPHTEKQSVTIGMAMTEKQGGSDVRRNTTRAYPIGLRGSGEAYELVGHKFFVSAPMCDAFLMLAQAEGGLSCFLVPRWRPDGSKNPLQILRLKDKMGNASNASSETELRGAFGWLIGDEGRGVANILEMVAMTRFDCLVSSAAAMRQHMTQIVHHTSNRSAFGRRLDQQPLMQNVLADLELEAEASTLMAFRAAEALDQMTAGNSDEASFVRLATPVGKYWVCKRQPGHAYEAMEVIGGSAVMENSLMPRFYREAPINTIWEGSGNVQCLDVLRVMQKDPGAIDVFVQELELARGNDKDYDRYLNRVKQSFSKIDNREYRARSLVEGLALGLQGSLLLRHGSSTSAEAFCRGRLQGNSGNTYGMLPEGLDCSAIINKARIVMG